jgi:DNA-binding XRE family transcriptional regulator
MSTDDLPRLARAVKQRRLALGLARLKAAQEAGISKDTWKRVEEALPVREMSYAAIDPILGWAVGSCNSIRAGGTPTVVESSTADPAVTLADVSDAGRGDTVRRVVESASIGTTNLTAREIRELSERIVGDLRREGVI